MAAIVGTGSVLLIALNAPSTARAGSPCLFLGPATGGGHGLVAIRPHAEIPTGGSGCATRFYLDRIGASSLYVLTVHGPGWHGTVHSHATRVDGLVGLPEILDRNLAGGGDADLLRLRERLEHGRENALRVRVLLATILIALALLAPARAVVGFAAAIAAALLLAAFDWTSLALLGILTLLGALLPRRSLWLFFAGYLVVLVAWPETQSLALLGPHPWGGGRFYGISNELETMLLAPALTLGLPAAPLVLLTVGWSKAGADGGGIFVFLAAYAWLLVGALRARGTAPARSRLLLVGVAVVVLGLLFVAVDAATGGRSHVTHGLAGGPGRLAHDLWHRWAVSWHGATGSPGRVLQCAICLAVLAWVATRRPRVRVVDALLIALAVSLLVNDTPQDVLFWGAVAAVALRRAVYAPRPMRRFAPLVLALPLLLFAAGCSTSKPGEATTTPLPSTVVGTVPAATTATATVPAQYQNGDPVAGKKVFLSAGCTGCHTLKDAGSTGTVGPNLDQAKPPLSLAVERVTKGAGAMPSFKGQLSDKQIADVTAYVVKASGGNPNG
ncbi:MAG TPA: c-type cytochrome [Gaiellaceae bacterium]|nr:c-type cytochrome [Gaiellaceae bacterium]